MTFKRKLDNILNELDLGIGDTGGGNPGAMPPAPTPEVASETPGPMPEPGSMPEMEPEPEEEKADVKGTIFQLKDQLKGYDDKRATIFDELKGVIGKADADEYTELLSEFVKATNDIVTRLMAGKTKPPSETPESPAEPPAGPPAEPPAGPSAEPPTGEPEAEPEAGLPDINELLGGANA